MRKFTWTAVLFIALITQGFSQTVFTSQATGGVWTLGTTWDQTSCLVGCVAGVDYPGPNDVAIIATNAGAFISLPRAGNPAYAVKDLFVVYNVANSIRTTGLTGLPTLTINGMLSGALDDLSDVAVPTVNIFHTSVTAASLNVIFTNSNHDDPVTGAVITSWGFNAPIPRVTFNPGAGNTARVDNFATRGTVTVQSGTLQLQAGQELRDNTGSSVLTVNSGTLLSTQGAINGGSTSTRFGTINVLGTLTSTSSTSTYINAATFTLGPSAALNNGFRGVNQTQGWWYQTTSPSTITLDATSTVQYNSGTDQFVYATNYGNMTFGNVPSTVTKTLSGSGIIFRGNLAIGTNVVFSPPTQVDFMGTATQTVTGAGTLTFGGGIEVTKTGGSLSINRATTISNGVIVTQGTLNLNAATSIAGGIQVSNDITSPGVLNLGSATISVSSGNIEVYGTLAANTSNTLSVSGTTTDFTDTGSGTMTLNNLTISGTTTISRSAWSITGNFTNSGSLTIPATTLITFTGGNTQTISGNAFSVGNVTINKTSSTLFNAGTVELFGVLTMTNGTFDADGSPAGTGGSGIFRLNSDTNGDARIGPMAGGSIVGEVTFERYFNNTTVNLWRNLAFPVTGVTYAQLGSSVPLAANSVAYYTESVLGNVDQGWTYVSSGTLNSTRGHSVRMLNVAPINVLVRGPLLQQVPAQGVSPYNFNVTFTDDPAQPLNQDGWNYVPNPFASPIHWNNSGWVKTRVDNGAAVWDVQNFTYRYYGVDWDGIVAQGQAFWVHTNAASPVLTCTESVKTTTSDPVFYRQASQESRMLISLKSSQYTDKAALQFRDDASPEYDGDFDAYKLQNPIFNLSTLSREGVALAANTLPKTPCTSDVRLNITNIEPGTYTLKFEGLSSFSGLESAELVDHFTNTSFVLEGDASHAFEVTADAGSYGSSRFELKFKFSEGSQPAPAVEAENDILVSKFEEGESYQWFLNGVRIEGATEASYRPVLNGTYSYEVNYKGCAMLSETIEVDAKKRVFPNPVFDDLKIQVDNLIPKGTGSGEIVIVSSLGEIVKQVSFNGSELVKSIDMRDVKPGQYMVSISANSKIIERVKIIVQ